MEQTIHVSLVVIAIILLLIAIYDIMDARLKYLSFNLVWLMIVIFLPIIGPIAYLFLRKGMRSNLPKEFNPDFNEHAPNNVISEKME
ncbi:PLD nuclease N-terminal domain-containing protein [Roseimarinus sediminis]|uniref:PLD nuclease N-terminal domain-containing protein n=1 Tax=Roseimarinus sediminis TaxID=1610899 RepID=UPI003D208AB5